MNTHRRLRIATLFVIVAAYVLAGIDAAYSAHRAAVARHASTIASNAPLGLLEQAALAPGRSPMSRFALKPHPVFGHVLPSVPGVNEPVQTYDVFAPPQNFTASQPRTAVNQTPQWSADESYIIFSSNRPSVGTTGQAQSVGRYHIWVIPANGSTNAVQVTTSDPQSGESSSVKHGEFFPALDPSNSQLAFTTDVNSVNVQSLYVIPFNAGSYLTSGTAAAPVTCDASLLNASAGYSKSIRPDKLNPGFDDVRRPTWGGAGALAFSGRDDVGATKGHYHIWYMYAGSLGYLPTSAPNNLPAKLTDGAQDQNNPAWSGDGNFIAFDSNSSGFADTGLPVAPGGSPLASTGTAGANHAIFLITPGGTLPGGVAATNGQLTVSGTDNVTPAWSFNTSNPYSNPNNSFQYLAFARAASPVANHDIYYLAVTQQSSGSGETPASNVAGTQAIGAGQPLYQVNAGGPAVAPYVADNYFAGGAQSPASTATVTTAATDDAPPAVYQTYRTTTAADASFTYTLPNFVPGGSYTLALHFNEPNTTATVGSRVFNVRVNGAPALTNYDIFARTNAANVARVETLTATADNTGTITVEFDRITAGQDAIVSGVEVLSINQGFALPNTTSVNPPNAVANVRAFPIPTGGIQVSWDPYSTAVAYNIYRGVGVVPTVAPIDLYSTVSATQTSFNDTQAVAGQAYYYIVTAVTTVVFTNSVRAESATNSAIHLTTETQGNNYDDTYPTWSAFSGVFSIGYQSNRSITYNDPKTGPVETAISLPQGVAPIGSSYVGILISQVLNLDPPSLMSFNSNEVIHINAGKGSILPVVGNESGSAERQIQAARPITFTVRLSNREAGIDDTGGPNGGPNVYIQIKDPDSKYQDSQGLEHKVFAEDPDSRIHSRGYSVTAATTLFNAFRYHGFQVAPDKTLNFTPEGVVGGSDGAGGTIQVGFATPGSVNPDPSNPGVPGPDPATYTAVGQEYECQYLNPTVANPAANQGDYGIPHFLAGFDDRMPLSGASLVDAPRPVANDVPNGITAEWLQLHRATDVNGKDISNDGNGGVLYSGTWTPPSASSDFVFDVIAYDKAVFPLSSVVQSTGFTAKNWRIYDNVWGASSAAFDTSADIMVVSDYACGQKFAATAFGGQGTLLENVLPTFFGAESYVTDVDTTKLPTYSWYVVYVNNAPHNFIAKIFENDGVFLHDHQRNTLGAHSYSDAVVADAGTKYGAELFKSQTYSVWRTLCRGGLDAPTLAHYLPSTSNQPAVNDGATTIAAGSVPIANRCVVWLAPYNGDLFTGPGTLADATTQGLLTDFTSKGGRLCVSGPDVGSVNPNSSLLTNVLHAQLVSASANTRGLVAGPNHTLTATDQTTIPTANEFWATTDWRADACFDALGPSVTISGGPHGTGQVVLGNPDVVNPIGGAGSDLNYADNSGSGLVFFEQTDATQPNLGLRTVYSPAGLETISNEYFKVVDDTTTPYDFHTQVRNNRSIIVHQIVSYLRTGTFYGFIRDTAGSAGNPVANATVYLTAAGGGPTGGPRKTYSALTGSNGFYQIYGVPQGTYNITAAAVGYASVTASAAQTVEGDVDVPVSIRIAQLTSATVTGTVKDANQKALSGATVKFTLTTDPTTSKSTTTRADGTYTINLPTTLAGASYTGVASLLGYLDSSPQPVVVTPGQLVNGINFVLNQAPATITGKVTDKTSGLAIRNATVTAFLGTATTASAVATTAADGTYTLSLQPGTYTLSATAANYNVVTARITVVAGQKVTGENFALTYTPAGSFGGFADTKTGGPLAGVVITATGPSGTITIGSGPVASPAAPNGDGRPLNYFAPAQPGTYTITYDATALGFGKKTVTGVVVKSGAFTRVPEVDFASGQLIGLFLGSHNSGPIGGVTVTVQTPDGLTIATTTTSGTTTSPAAPAGDGKPINYSVTLVPGTYCNVVFSRPGSTTVVITKITIPIGVVRVDGEFPAIHTFSAGLQFFSLPYNYNTTWDSLFGPLGVSRSHVALWQQSLGQYVLDPTSPATRPILGYGYWIRLPKAEDITTAGPLPLTSTVSVPLTKGWNMIGVPSTTAIDLNHLNFANPVTPSKPITWAQATSIAYNLVSPTLYSYDPATGQYVAVGTKPADQLQPWSAYWIRANDNATLLIPTTGP